MAEPAFEIRDAIRAHAPVIPVLRDIIAAYTVPAGDLLMLMPHIFPPPMGMADISYRYKMSCYFKLEICCNRWTRGKWLLKLFDNWEYCGIDLYECDDPLMQLWNLAIKKFPAPAMQLYHEMRDLLDSKVAICLDFLLHGPRAMN